MKAELGEALEQYVTDLVDSGRYGSRNEILRESVRLLQERETRMAELDAALAEGVADADAGRTLSVKEAFDAVRSELKVRTKAL
jgi:antitoxin ParD1/3/4